MGGAAMKTLHPIFLFITAFIAVYLEATFETFRNLTGAQFDLLPPLIVYAALTHPIEVVAALALFGGLCFDSLSANPLGVTVLPLFAGGVVIYRYRSLLLRDHTYAQFILGLLASALCPALTLIILLSLDATPIFGWISLWQWFVLTLIGGLTAPLFFKFFDWLQRALTYTPEPELSFRDQREMQKRSL